MTIKKAILSLAAVVTAAGAWAQSGTFSISGNCDALGDSARVYIIVPGTSKEDVKQDIALGNGFDLSYAIDGPRQCYIMALNDGKPDGDNRIMVPAMPGENAVITGNGDKFDISGSQFYQDYGAAMQCLKAPKEAYENFIGGLYARMAMGEDEEAVSALYDEQAPALIQALSDAVRGYIAAHPDQEASAAIVTEAGEDVEEIEQTAALLSDRVKNSPASIFYKATLESAKRAAEREARQNALVGQPAPDFTLVDINGNPLTLSSLQGKWVILDFWGAWCKWCIKGMPDMKEYYAKYSDKLQILGIDCNDTMEKWKAAVEREELPWLHVYNPMDATDDVNPVKLYGVSGFPTKVVINPEGVVAKVIVGEDPAFYNYLDSVLN